jgi:predicted DNA-binding protein (UPF0278 family)
MYITVNSEGIVKKLREKYRQCYHTSLLYCAIDLSSL